MPKPISKIAIISIAIAAAGTICFTFISGGNSNVSNSNTAIASETITQETLTSVWDKDTKPNYTGVADMTVYRRPNCGCCGVWVDHAKQHGFKITDIKTEEMAAIKQQHNVPEELASCHTAIINGYVMEGHIPADDIKRFLAEKPDNLVGLTVPGMPIGTPGMETRDIKQPFQVLAFNDRGEVEVFKEYQSY